MQIRSKSIDQLNIAWREGFSNIGPIYELAMKIMQLLNIGIVLAMQFQ